MNLHRTARTMICAALLVLSAGCSQQVEPEAASSSSSSSSSAAGSGDPATSSVDPTAGSGDPATSSVDPTADSGDAATSSADRTANSGGPATSSADRTANSRDLATSSEDPSRTSIEAPEQSTSSLVATGNGAKLAAYADPGGEVVETFENPTPTGVPLTFMVVSTAPDWTQVQLPVRPNGSTAWVSTDEVTITQVTYALKVSTKDKTLQLYRADELLESFPVAVGTGGTPTPKGTFYLTELITPTNAGYGAFAYGISAFSEELTSFGGGPGQIGLHGTDDADSIGRAVSHGCIRMTNPAITKLSALLPLGTPIEIN